MGALVALAAWGAEAGAQGAGEIRVSATILEPVRSVVPQTSVTTSARTGVVAVATGSPVAGPTSQLLMVSVVAERDTASDSSSAPLRVTMHDGSVERALTPGVALPVHAADADDLHLTYRVRVGAAADASPVRLRVSYLSVPGT